MNDSIHDLQEQAKTSWRYWHLYLEIQRRRLQKHVQPTAADNANGDLIHLLTTIGLPLPPALPQQQVPAIEPIEGIRFRFWAAVLADGVGGLLLVQQLANEKIQSRELMRMALEDRVYLENAADRLNAALDLNPTANIFQAAEYWALLHGGVPQSWQLTDVDPAVVWGMPTVPNLPQVEPISQESVPQHRIIAFPKRANPQAGQLTTNW